MKITPTPLTINQLFSTRNEQFVIPAYQRRYAWEEKQCKELFNDIKYLSNEDSHLLGNLVCLTVAHRASINQLEVIDGQQRITTLTLLLNAISEKLIENDDHEEAQKINGLLKASGVDRVKSNKVVLGELDNSDYEKVIKNERLESIHNKNLLENANSFKEWLDELTKNEFNSFYYKLMDRVSVIRLDVYQAKDAYKLFETINNRGLSLTSTDIIKNFLLGHASSFDDDVLEKVKDNWKDIIITLDGINTDEFFRHYMCAQLGQKITYTYLNDRFKKHYVELVEGCEGLPEYRVYAHVVIKNEEDEEDELDDLDVDEDFEDEDLENEISNKENSKESQVKISPVLFTRKLADYAKTYANIRNRKFSNQKINNAIYDLQRIKSVPSYTFLLELFYRDNVSDSDKLKILNMIAVFMLRRHICSRRTGVLDDIFSDLVQTLEKENIVQEVRKRLIRDLPGDDEFKLNFSKADFRRSTNRAKYVIEQFEYNLHQTKGEFTINSGTQVHLEHIIPQTITTKKSKREFGDWEEYLGPDAKLLHKEIVDTIGNYTLLGQKLNIVASNNPFKEKLKEYAKSSIKITQEIVTNYNEFKFDEVKQRSKSLAKQALKIWTLK